LIVPPGTCDERVGLTRRPPAQTNGPLRGDVHVLGYDDADVREVAGVPVLAGGRLLEVVRWVPEEMRSPQGRAGVVARSTRAAARAG
jgi:hypothetical protein